MSPCDRKGGGEADSSEVKKEVRRKAAPLTSVLFVEQTPGMYAARLRETEEKLASTSGLRL